MRYMDEPHTQGGCTDKSGMRYSEYLVGEMLMVGLQEGDRFVRLPEVYVKGNNVRSKIHTAEFKGKD